MGFVLWQDGSGDGYDRCALLPAVAGAKLSGTAVLPRHGAGATARYCLVVDRTWRVLDLDVRMSAPGHEVRVRLTSPEAGWWERDGVRLPSLDGCLDVALDFTPVALTPLIRRLALTPGERRDVDVVAVGLPDLAVTRERVGVEHDEADRWLHHTRSGSAAVHVGPQALVTEYEDVWTAVALG